MTNTQHQEGRDWKSELVEGQTLRLIADSVNAFDFETARNVLATATRQARNEIEADLGFPKSGENLEVVHFTEKEYQLRLKQAQREVLEKLLVQNPYLDESGYLIIVKDLLSELTETDLSPTSEGNEREGDTL